MAVTTLAPLNLCFLLSEEEGDRSREAGTLAQYAGSPLPPGTLVDGAWSRANPVQHKPVSGAGNEANITGILGYWADATQGAVDGTFIVREAEVNEAYLIFDGMDRNKVADALFANCRIVMRTGVLAAPGSTFGIAPAVDPALADTVYGPEGIAALEEGGIYGASAGGEVERVEKPVILQTSDGRVSPVAHSRGAPPPELVHPKPMGLTEGEVVDDLDTLVPEGNVLPGGQVPPTGEEPDVPEVARPVPVNAPSQSAQQTDRPTPPVPGA
jgi:hypothetical protein